MYLGMVIFPLGRATDLVASLLLICGRCNALAKSKSCFVTSKRFISLSVLSVLYVAENDRLGFT